jgi:hypothetical protein
LSTAFVISSTNKGGAVYVEGVARLCGKLDRVSELLAPVYGCFTESLNTMDLKQGKALLDELAGKLLADTDPDADHRIACAHDVPEGTDAQAIRAPSCFARHRNFAQFRTTEFVTTPPHSAEI